MQLGPAMYRLRRGNWRIIYRIYDSERLILVGAVRRRNERTYREVERLFPDDRP
jgi:mRNA interferase RelE/StbE